MKFQFRPLILILTSCLNTAQICSVSAKAARIGVDMALAAGVSVPVVKVCNSLMFPKDLSSFSPEDSSNFRQILLEYAGYKVSRETIAQIEFKKGGQYASLPHLDKPTIIIDASRKFGTVEKSALLHEMGHVYHRNSSYLQVFSVIFLSCQLNEIMRSKISLTKKTTITIGGVGGILLLSRAFRRYDEIQADNFAIECLKAKLDYAALDASAKDYKNRQELIGDRSKTFDRLGISQRYYIGLKQQKSRVLLPLIDLIDDEHPTDYDRAKKFELAAQAVRVLAKKQ